MTTDEWWIENADVWNSDRWTELADGWIENINGNMVWINCGEVLATAYQTDDGMWGGIWNGASDGRARRLKAKYDCADEAQEAIEAADSEGSASLRWWPPDDEWIAAKKGGYYRRVNGTTVAVKQAKSKSWYASSINGLLGQHGRTSWFATADEVCRAVDAYAVDDNGLCWIARQ